MNDATIKQVQFGRDVAELLGKGWTARLKTEFAYPTVGLEGPESLGLTLTWGGYRKEGRIEAHGSMSHELRGHLQSYGSDPEFEPEITFAETKTAEQAARDIQRRLLPRQRELTERAGERQRASEQRAADLERVTMGVQARLGPMAARRNPGHFPRPPRDPIEWGSYDDGGHVEVSTYSGGRATFEIRVPLDKAAAIADFLRTLYPAPAPDFYQIGREAQGRGESSAPALNAEVQAAIKGMAVGGGGEAIMREFARGWSDANLEEPAVRRGSGRFAAR